MAPRRARSNAASRGYTIREGTSEKHWYGVAGYVAAMTVMLAYALYLIASGPADEMAGIMIGIILLVAAVLSLSAAVMLFKDSAYVRGVGVWMPKWWYYLGIPIGIGTVAIVGGAALGSGAGGLVIAIMVFPLLMYGSSIAYLYHRHQHVGVP